jgi:hypothetical protein
MKNKNLIFSCIVGSQAYGTATPTSDIDKKGVYVQPTDEVVSFKYQEQVEVGKDECYYEIRRFLQLLQSANPTMLELLYSSEDCVLTTSPAFQLIINNRDKFLTQKCLNSFGGYAVAQIKKAKGLNKKMNWEKEKVARKTPIDFCYIYEEGKTKPVIQWLKEEKYDQKWCGLVALDHFKDCYALYYDHSSHYGEIGNRTYEPLGFHGIQLDDSNAMRLSSVPKYMKPEAIMHYDKDWYTVHCKDFREYNVWLENRNTQRYVDIKGHNQQIDGKNILHCRRLLDTAIEIATEHTLKVRRPNAEYLLKIRKGEVPIQEIIDQAEEDLKGLDALYAKSGLPKDVDSEFVNDLLLEVRKAV